MILEKKISSYKTRMILTINNLNQQDVGSYVCVSGKSEEKIVETRRWRRFRAVISLVFLCERKQKHLSFHFFLLACLSIQVIHWVVQTEQLGFEVGD
jgi:hypothetical protein